MDARRSASVSLAPGRRIMAQQPCIASRRLFLSASAGAAAALWTDWAQLAAAQPRANGKAKSVILIFNCGAPSHIDLWDMKPEATDTVRGEFKPIATNVPGIQVSELMPR